MALVAVDLDGVCYEWSKTARYMLREYRGYSKDGPLGQESDDWNYIQENVEPEDWTWLWKYGVPLGLFRYGHMVAGARRGLETLRESGAKITLITHRPETAVNDTLDWIALYFKNIPVVGLRILSNEEKKTVEPFDIIIDDKPQNVQDALDAGRHAILFDRTWNRKEGTQPMGSIRAYGWPATVEAVKELMDA